MQNMKKAVSSKKFTCFPVRIAIKVDIYKKIIFFSCNFDTKFFIIFFFINQILIDCMIFPIQLSLIWYITYKVYFAHQSQKWNLMSTAVECSSHQKILWSRPHEMAGPKRVKCQAIIMTVSIHNSSAALNPTN